MVRNIISTIEQLEEIYYGRYMSLGQEIRKDAAITTGVTGFYNPVYGKKVWNSLSFEANTFGYLPKKPWDIITFDISNSFAG